MMIADLHAHPVLPAYLYGRDLRRHWMSGSLANPLASRSDFVMLRRGGVRLLGSSLYAPAREMKQWAPLRWLARLMPHTRKLLHASRWELLLDMMDELERQIERAQGVELARSNAELDRVLTSPNTALVHTVEGAHVLEGDLRNVEALARRGVASLTLAHLFPDRAAGQVVALPPWLGVRRWWKRHVRVELSRGLSAFGRDLVEAMVEHRIIPDLAHATPAARAQVLELVNGRAPVVASHVGAHACFPDPYNLRPDEIRAIARTGGVIGVISEPRWLQGRRPEPGLLPMWRTMEHIRDVTGSWEHVAIGTDFDGGVFPPGELADASRMPNVAAMLKRRGVPDADIARVMGANVRRVLRLGWRETAP
jgi:membrane dipeptidase